MYCMGMSDLERAQRKLRGINSAMAAMKAEVGTVEVVLDLPDMDTWTVALDPLVIVAALEAERLLVLKVFEKVGVDPQVE